MGISIICLTTYSWQILHLLGYYFFSILGTGSIKEASMQMILKSYSPSVAIFWLGGPD